MGSTEQLWRKAILSPRATIGDAIRNLNEVSIKIVLISDGDDVLRGTISDGDIRRGLLRGLSMNSPIADIIQKDALVVPPEMNPELVKQLMIANKLQQIPIVDKRRCVIGLHLWDELSSPLVDGNLMVIMAGGLGTRMRPHTENCPKPMLQVAGKPMLEHIIDRAKLDGFKDFVISIHYLGHMVEAHFGDGKKFGVKINYLREEFPLGTAGALSLIFPLTELPFVVTNGDIITDIKYGELLDFHIRHNSMATMAVRTHEWQHPFGVVQTQGIDIIDIEEKPISHSYINAGVYVLDPSILHYLPKGSRCDMPNLFDAIRNGNQRTIAYPMHEPWLDVGRPDDLNYLKEIS